MVAESAVGVSAEPTPARPLRIAQFATAVSGGGAEAVARDLHTGYLAAGHRAEIWVGHRNGVALPGLNLIVQSEGAMTDRWAWRLIDALRARSGRIRGARRLAEMVRHRGVAEAGASLRRGDEDFAYPGAWALLNRWRVDPPDIIQAHNLHGGYFDLRALPDLSRVAPLVLTLHDQWLFTGHCAHGLACERWRTGCGECPDLSLPPALTKDNTAENWQRKRDLYRRGRFYVAAPSQWLLNRVAASPLAETVVEKRLIRLGVDRDIFARGDKATARARLGLPRDSAIVLFAAHGTRANPWKDFATLERAVRRLPRLLSGKPVILLAVGQAGATRQVDGADLRMLPFVSDRRQLADLFRAADVYLHATRADNAPIVIMEALACGTPVVASAVGGIPELVDAGETGWLTPVGDADAMAAQAARLLLDPNLHAAFSQAALARAARDFDVRRQIADYLDWTQELVAEARAARVDWR